MSDEFNMANFGYNIYKAYYNLIHIVFNIINYCDFPI